MDTITDEAKGKLRPNVVAIIFDNEKNVLIVSRAEDPLHWQFPQGGVDEGESDETAILREMNEELSTNSFTVLDKCQEKHIYRWPEKLLRDEYVGQEQVLMLLKFTGHTFDLKPDKREIGGMLWISQDKIETFLHEYRKPVWNIVKQHLQKIPYHFNIISMLQSKLFSKTRRDIDKEEVAKNAQILLKAGFIDKTMAGVYTLLPLGFRVIKKIEHIIREEMQAIEGQEILMPALHPKAVWETSGRWETEDNLFRFTSYYTKLEFAFGATHEEIVTPLAKKIILSYKDLPRYVFQIQTKFRDEQRAKSGILRGREFIMKDLYSFHADEKDLDEYYKRVERAYTNIFERVGIGEKTYKTYAAGGSFSKYSHEYQTVSEIGEDLIHLCTSCQIAINNEIFADSPICPECNGKDFTTHASIEVGNIFKLKTKFSKAFNLKFSDVNGQENEVLMGCYGIGLGRLMGTAVELLAQDEKMMWPKTIAPFSIHLIELISKDIGVYQKSQELYQELTDRNIEVLYDNRNERAGVKFHDADLIGLPIRIIVSQKSLEKGGFEVNGKIYTSLREIDLNEQL